MAILPCPPPVKIVSVAVCTLRVVATSHKKTNFAPLATDKKNKKICVANEKTLVCKVVGSEKLHIFAKNGVMIRKFAMVLPASNQAHLGRKPSELIHGTKLCEGFISKILVCHVCYFS